MSYKKEGREWEEIVVEEPWEDGYMGMLDCEMIHIKWQCLRKETAFILKVTHYTSNKTC